MSSLNQKQIEEYLAQNNDGERSEDNFESAAEDHENFYKNRDLLHNLENSLEIENYEMMILFW